MSDPTIIGSRQEAVQPSLWDRLVDDLPGLGAEVAALRGVVVSRIAGAKMAQAALSGDAADEDAKKQAADAAKRAAEELVEAFIQGGPREIERQGGLDEETRARARRLWQLALRKRRLEERGIVVTQDVLREAVRRDIEMLFNIERYEARHVMTELEAQQHDDPADLIADFPEVRTSVVNYGGPSFSGRLSSSFEPEILAREIKALLNAYEPRLKKDTVKVVVKLNEKTGMRIEIDGVLLLSPVPERLRLSTTIDLDNGQATTLLEEV